MFAISAAAGKVYKISSPDGRIHTDISVGEVLSYSVNFKGMPVISESTLSMTLADGKVWGKNPKVEKYKTKSVKTEIPSPFYRADRLEEEYNSATINFKGGWGVEFRAYNDGVAYRFTSSQKKPLVVEDEEVIYNFPVDATAYAAYTKAVPSIPTTIHLKMNMMK